MNANRPATRADARPDWVVERLLALCAQDSTSGVWDRWLDG